MNKKIFLVALAMLIIASAVVFAQILSRRPAVDWSGNNAWAINTNPAPKNRSVTADSTGGMKDITLCIIYKDGSGIRREFNTSSFNLAPGERKDFTAPGEVVNASTTSCEIIYD